MASIHSKGGGKIHGSFVDTRVGFFDKRMSAPCVCVCLMYNKREGGGVAGIPGQKVGRLIGARRSAEETKKRSAPGCRSGISSVATSVVA